jgi:hypothetical protein
MIWQGYRKTLALAAPGASTIPLEIGAGRRFFVTLLDRWQRAKSIVIEGRCPAGGDLCEIRIGPLTLAHLAAELVEEGQSRRHRRGSQLQPDHEVP